MTLGMALSGFHHHRRLTTMVRRDGDLGGRQGRLPRMSEKLFPMSPEKSYLYFWVLSIFLTLQHFLVLSLILVVGSKRLKYIDELSWVFVRVAFTAKLFFPLRCYAP
jgi:hypothetical protein